MHRHFNNEIYNLAKRVNQEIVILSKGKKVKLSLCLIKNIMKTYFLIN
jgi:hypothetical protein